MKRILFLLSLCVVIPLNAQDKISDRILQNKMEKLQREQKFWENWPYKFEARLGYGGYAMVDEINFLHDWNENIYGPGYDRPAGLEGLYAPQDGPVYMTGQIFGEFSWHIKRRFTLSAGLYFNGFYGSLVDPDTEQLIRKKRGVSATIIPSARFYWANFNYCRLYSEIGIGVGVGTFDGVTEVFPAFQMTGIGITAGREVFFFAEYSVGTLCMGGKIGLGYRF